MQFLRIVFLAAGLISAVSANSQQFSKFFKFAVGNPYSGMTFITSHELKDTSGYLILADRYQTTRSAMLIRTDPGVNEVWSVAMNFQTSPAPYDNINFLDVGELANGNYFVFGVTGINWHPYYVFFVFDTAGALVNYRTIYDSQNQSGVGNYAQVHPAADGSAIIAISEYERFGFYRIDTALNVVASAFYTHPINTSQNWGRDCIMLHDSSMLITHGTCLTHTDANGVINWSKEYTFGSHIKCVYESQSGMIYGGGWGTTGPSCATLAKFDGNGNPVFLKNYNMTPFANTSGIWNIFPCDNDHLMLYSDSALIVTDTNGNVIGWGKTVDAYNYKFVHPTNSDDFLMTGLIFQDSTGMYEYTLMRFDDSTEMSCLRPRGIVTTPASVTQTNLALNIQPHTIAYDSFAFTVNYANVNYDPLNGCPQGPLSVADPVPAAETLTLFPNPASDHVQLQCGESQCAITVYDMMGREVYTSVTGSNGLAVIDVSAWAEAVYSVVVVEGEARTVQRFVVKH